VNFVRPRAVIPPQTITRGLIDFWARGTAFCGWRHYVGSYKSSK